jgi:hypothetical protein
MQTVLHKCSRWKAEGNHGQPQDGQPVTMTT